jgi:hypothetical protein
MTMPAAAMQERIAMEASVHEAFLTLPAGV